MTNLEIANTIISQFGKTFPMMVGMKSPVAIESGVQFKIGVGNGWKATKGINTVVITLNAMDTYDVRFVKVTNKYPMGKDISSVEGVYNDQLNSVFESATGLYTRF